MHDIHRLLESNFYIHYEMHPLPNDVRKSCESMVAEIYRILGIEYWESYSNDVFELYPSSEAECDCGWDDLPEWDELCNLQHRPECFQNGTNMRCDCDYPQREEEIILKMVHRFGPGHSKDCIMFRPQLIYKPEDFRIWWYRYPLREAETSRKTDVEHFSNIIRKCIDSIRR